MEKIIKYIKKIEDMSPRDKISIIIWMVSFLLILNAVDFSSFKADLIWSWTWSVSVESELEEETKEDDKEEIEEEEVVIENNEVEEVWTWSAIETEEVLEPVLVENPVLIENKKNGDDESTKDTNLEIVESVDKNDEVLDEIEEEKKIEVTSDIVVDRENIEIEKENNNSEAKDKTEASDNETDEIDEKINAVIEEIKEIEEKQNEISENVSVKIEPEEEWLSEEEFTVSWQSTVDHNERVKLAKEEKEIEIQEEKIKALEEERMLLEERLLSLEEEMSNDWEDQEIEYTEEALQEWLSMREIQKQKEAEEQRKKEEELAKQKELEKIEQDKRITSKTLFYWDDDWDWISNHIEEIIETNPKLIDTDWDGYSESVEIDKFYNPNWEWFLFPDISERSNKKDEIIKWIKKWLVFVRAWDKFLEDEEIYRFEALKIIVSALYPDEIYRESEFFTWVTLYDDVSEDDYYTSYLKVAIKHNIFDWIIADEFSPYDTFSKSEFISILVKATEKPIAKTKMKWVDTDYDNWFTPYFSTAKDLWIINTSTSARIFPLKNITRIQAVELALEASRYE